MTVAYHVVKIEDFDSDDRKTAKILNEMGTDNWDLVVVEFKLNEKTGNKDALCVFKK